MASFNKKLLVAGFITLALLIASHHVGAAAAPLCESRTGIMCTSLEMCAPICLQRVGGYTGGYCSTQHVVGDPSCVCTKPCAAQSTKAAAAAPEEKQPVGGGEDARRMGMAD